MSNRARAGQEHLKRAIVDSIDELQRIKRDDHRLVRAVLRQPLKLPQIGIAGVRIVHEKNIAARLTASSFDSRAVWRDVNE